MAKTSNSKTIKTTAEVKSSKPVEIGATGTNNFSGLITEEYLGTLSGTAAMRVYDKMRKSDATVKAALSAVQLPIRRAQWFVTPGGEAEGDKVIADFVADCLFDQMTITWDDFLRQALLSTTYGVMVFEKVFTVRMIGGVNRIIWQKFAPRLPSSISSWQMKDGSDGIQQNLLAGASVSIPIEKLLIFVNEKEGDNWWGVSLLRPAYKHWYIKENLEKIDAIAHERQGLGVPFIKLPPGASDSDKNQAQTILSNMRAHEEGYLIEPDGMSIEFKDMHASGTKDAARAIDYHDRLITKSVLAQFLSLGSGASGSYALSQDQSSLFLQSIEAIATNIADSINKYAIRQLVDLNFPGVTVYPKLDYAGISRADVDKITTSYQRLIQTGGLTPAPGDESYFRKIMGLPEQADDTTLDSEGGITPEEISDDLGLSEGLSKKKVQTSEIERKVLNRLSKIPDRANRMDFIEKTLTNIKGLTRHKEKFAEVHHVLASELSTLKSQVFKEENNFKSWRKLTFAEKKVNFASMQNYMNKAEAGFVDSSTEVLKVHIDTYLDRLTKAVNAGDSKAVKDLELGGYAEYKAVVKEYLADSFVYGKNSASREMDVKAPANPQELSATLDILADTIATNHHYELENEAKLAVTNQLAKFGEKEIRALQAAALAMSGSLTELTRNAAAVLISDALNKGRSLVFEKNKKKIYALQRSEILDEVTCNFCLSMDGRIVDVDDRIAKEGTFHSNCRGIWVEILKDEEELPDISGVPNSIRDRLGDSVNELVQPKKPIVKKDSLAAQAIAKGKAGQQEASELKSTDPMQFHGCGGRCSH